MNVKVFIKTYAEPPIDEREILRYAGAKGGSEQLSDILADAVAEARGVLSYKVAYCVLPYSERCGVSFFGDAFTCRSELLRKSLEGCTRVIIFAATVGAMMDRLIAKYSLLSPAKMLLLQAFGAERAEALCDTFISDMEAELGKPLRPRRSPGYSDIPLSLQRDIFATLEPENKIGVCLTDSYLMTPSKSVTAFVGIPC